MSTRSRLISSCAALLLAVPLFWAPTTASAAGEVLVSTVSYGDKPDEIIKTYTIQSETKMPWVAIVHGGSWAAGTVDTSDRAAAKFVAAGFQVFSIDYTEVFGPRAAQWPQQRIDVANGIEWLKDHARQFDIDPDRGAVYGFSVGGHIAASVGAQEVGLVRAVVTSMGPNQPHRLADVAAGDPKLGYGGDLPTPGVRTLAYWAAVAAGCPRSVTWMACQKKWDDFIPEKHLDAGDPPFLVIQGMKDVIVPPHDAFTYWLGRAGVSRTSIKCLNRGHDEFCGLDGGVNERQVMSFLKAKTAAA